MKIVVCGGSGFIGKGLVPFLQEAGHSVVILSREPSSPPMQFWDPAHNQLPIETLEGCDVVINLCGGSIFGRWSGKKKEEIRSSRLIPTRYLCERITTLLHPPKLYIGVSAVGYYGDRPGERVGETAQPGEDFLAKLCVEWEETAKSSLQKYTRVVLPRLGIVFGKGGGALQYMEKGFSSGMGGVIGSGKQYMSWISLEDLCRAFLWIIEREEISGGVNLVSPDSLTNQEFTEIGKQVFHRSALAPIPKFALQLLLGEGANVFLYSVQAVPRVLQEGGFSFHFPTLREALISSIAH